MEFEPKLLGEKTPLPEHPEKAVLDTIPITSGNAKGMVVRLETEEFTSLCPVTGAPDFATIIVDYAPSTFLIESKAFKLFMGSYRNVGMFHEIIAADIGGRLTVALDPHWIRVTALFKPRGGVPITVWWEDGELPALCHYPVAVPSVHTR